MTHLTCPVCGDSLIVFDRVYTCPQRHSFDIAREGYVNLLVPRRKPPEFPGDSLSMLRARRAFLERGHYLPLSDAVNDVAVGSLGGTAARPAAVADIGAGEGWYIGRLAEYLAARGRTSVSCYGVDIAKDATRLAAKRYRDVTFAVADVWARLPFGDGSMAVLLDIFAPRNVEEFSRVLAPGGTAVVVIPGESHLAELRAELPLIGMAPDKREQVEQRFSGVFRLRGEREIGYEMELAGDDLYHLVAMTPNARHIDPEEMMRLQNRSMRVTAGFTILEFEKQVKGPGE